MWALADVAAQEKRGGPMSGDPNGQRPQPDRPRILLVEDDDRMLHVFDDQLVPVGIEVVAAKSKTAAEALIGGEYRLAVCDLQIPSHDGWLDADVAHGMSILGQLRSQQPDVPVIVFSGYSLATLPEGSAVAGLPFFTKSALPECLAEVKMIVRMASD